MERSIWIGFDPREAAAFAVTRHSVERHLTQPIPIYGLVLPDLQEAGLYTRPTTIKTNGEGRTEIVDVLSIRNDYDGRIATQHANARFLVPHLARSRTKAGWRAGWALFMDGDMLARGNLVRMFDSLDSGKAVYCVKHHHEPPPGTKMDGQIQTQYARKNWTSFIAFNCDHPANESLTLELINTLPGRDLHRLCWLDDDEIGELRPEWNFLVGHTDTSVDPKVLHFTDGVPDMVGYENVAFSDEWRATVNDWARGALSLPA